MRIPTRPAETGAVTSALPLDVQAQAHDYRRNSSRSGCGTSAGPGTRRADLPVPTLLADSCWDVPISEVGRLGSTQQGRKVYESHAAGQRALLPPMTEEIAK